MGNRFVGAIGDLSSDATEFRAQVRSFLSDSVPERYRPQHLGFSAVTNFFAKLPFAWGDDRKSDDGEARAVAAAWPAR